MGLLTGSKTPSIFDVIGQQTPVPSALSKISGMLGGNQAYPQPPSPLPTSALSKISGMLGGDQASVQPPSPLPTPAPAQSGARPGNLGGGPTPMSSASPAMAGSAPQPEPIPASTNLLIDALKSYFGIGMQKPRIPNLLEQFANPNGVPYESQAARPWTLNNFYGPHGISPTATYATAASPINYMGLFGAQDPYWGSNAMPGMFPVTQSPMMHMESMLRGTPYEDYNYENYRKAIGAGNVGPEGSNNSNSVADIEQALRDALNYPARYNNDNPQGEWLYDPDLYAGGG